MPVISDPENLEFLKLHSVVDFANRDVLEIGCGGGRLTALYHEISRSVTGIDLDFEGLQIASDYVIDNTQYTQADSTKLPFKDNSFDVALLAWSL